MKSTRIWLALLSLTLTSACASTGATECAWVKVISVTEGEINRLTLDTKRQIAAHNEKVETFCR